MDIIKKLGLILLTPLFVILLFATALDIGFVRSATHPATVKRLVAESGIYSSVVPSLLQKPQIITTQYGNISTSDPEIKQVANSVLSPIFIQQNAEMAIDNTYDWLDGKIAEPNFKIDLNGTKTLFANRIADVAQKRLSKLPRCTLAQSRAIAQSGQYDAFNATCLPVGVSPTSVAEQIKTSLVNQKEFLKETNISPADIKNGNNNQSVFNDQLKDAPKQYQHLKKTPLILSLLTILTGVGIVFLSSTWLKGLKHAGIILLVVGLLMLVFAWGLNKGVSSQVVTKIKIDNAQMQKDVRLLIIDITQLVDKNYWVFGGLYTILGGAGIATAIIMNRNRDAVLLTSKESTPEDKGASDEPKRAKKD
ncbi:MAG TPA: hypothetical protein VLF88_01285 [Candidatus Babeliales bacterium]|nr:hypothetical protein [Candidatus Babeliales bacterium]